MKRLLVLPVVLAMVVTFAPGAFAAHHRTIFVDDNCGATHNGTKKHPFCTINQGLAAANPGDTIRVAPGFYNELVDVNKADIKLLGPQAKHIGTRAGRADLRKEAVVAHDAGDFRLDQNNITVRGFTIMDVQDVAGSLEAGISMNQLFSGYKIINNVIRNNVQGMALGASGVGASLISGNLFLANNNASAGSNSGTGIDGAFETHNVTIKKNSFRNNNGQSILFERLAVVPAHSKLTVAKNIADSPFLFYKTVDSTISRNQLKGGNGSALFFGDDDARIIVVKNTIAAPSFRGIRFRIDFGGAAPTQFTITRNKIQGTGIDGIAAGDPGDATPGALTNSLITRNTISGSDGDGILFASNGAHTSQSSGNTVSRNVILGNRHLDVEDLTVPPPTGTNGTANTYSRNRCQTSSPASIC